MLKYEADGLQQQKIEATPDSQEQEATVSTGQLKTVIWNV